MENPPCWLSYLFGVFIGALALWFYLGMTTPKWENRLIEAELAEFVVDSTTGDTTFIIYAEQETK
jgi:hypothetical protein